jgi:class 3 adenylate cyclase
MHFLHSSGIVHRDLKSLNLLLDHKWNVKVSDFGLTRFTADMVKNGKDVAGSIHWTAPEVLNELPDVDLILADVYSFGIILWELLTREQPYVGLSPAAVAVAVIRDGIRPPMPESEGSTHPAEYEELTASCWHPDPTIRPTFLEIMTRLSSMHGDSSMGGTSNTSKTSSDSNSLSSASSVDPVTAATSTPTAENANKKSASALGSWSVPAAAAGTGDASAVTRAARPPEGEVTIVFTDITRAASLWEFNAAAMRDATLLHNALLRHALVDHRGYEVVFARERNSGEGSFCMVFHSTVEALSWCNDVQRALLAVDWPEALLAHPGAAETWGDTDDRILFKGLRVRMGVHAGAPRLVRDPMTRRVEYVGSVVNTAARITALAHGGQIVLSQAVYNKLKADKAKHAQLKPRLGHLGKFEMPDAPQGILMFLFLFYF